MTSNRDPSGKKPKRLTPEELAGEVARRLKLDRGGHRKSSRIDIVTISRIVMGLGVVVLGFGVFFAAKWAVGLAGFETTGIVGQETPIFGCPGELQAGVLFSGETVELVGRSEDGLWLVVRHPRGPGNMVYADAAAMTPADDPSRLRVRTCEPRSDEVIAAALAATTSSALASTSSDPVVSSTDTIPTTTVPGDVTTTARRGRTDHSRHPVPTTTTTTRPGSPTTSTPTPPTTGPTTTTTRPTTTTTRPTTTTTRPATSTTSTTQPTTTTTTVEVTTTTVEEPTTTSPTTTTIPETTTIADPPPVEP